MKLQEMFDDYDMQDAKWDAARQDEEDELKRYAEQVWERMTDEEIGDQTFDDWFEENESELSYDYHEQGQNEYTRHGVSKSDFM